MDNLILLAKSIGILSLFYVVYVLVLRRNTLFNANRHYLIAGIIAAITLPFVQFTRTIIITLPSQPEPLFFETPTGAPLYIESATILEAPFSVDWWQVALVTYLVGLLIMLVRLSTQLLSLQRLISSGTIVSKNRYTYVSISQNVAPFSFFSYIVYNPEIHTQDELEMILAHEQVHASQWHSVDILLTQLILAIQWFNPFTWLYKRSLEQNLEYIADKEAVQQITNTQHYQRTLVKVSSPLYRPALTNQFYQSFIKKRIIMLNTPQSRKQSVWKLGIILPVLALFMYSFNVKEVTEYVEEETPAFAKAETTPESKRSFTISTETTDSDLAEIEAYFEKKYTNTKIKFSKINHIAGELRSFDFATKMGNQQRYVTRFSINSANERFTDYTIIPVAENEIHLLQGTEKMILSDKGLVSQSTITPNSVSSETLGQHPAIIVNDVIVSTDTQEVSYSSDEPVVVLLPTQAMATYGAQAKDGAIVIKDPEYTTKINGKYLRTPKSLALLTPTKKVIQDTYSFIITKNTEPWELDSLEKVLKEKHGATLTIKNVDYNSDGEITSIRLDFKDASGNNKNYTVQSSSPIKDIFIYRNADGSSGMGNSLANSNMEIEQQLNGMRQQMKERRNAITQQRDSMRVGMDADRTARRNQMEERREEMRARMEENRSLQGRASADSMRFEMGQRRDSMRAQMKERRDEMRSNMEENRSLQGRASADSMRFEMGQRRDSMRTQMMERRDEIRTAKGNATQTSDKAKAGYIKLDDATYYYVKKKDSSISYYDRWGVQIKDSDDRYQRLVNAPNFSADGDTEKDVVNRLERYKDTNIRMSAAYIYYVNDKKVTYEEFKKLDPDNIEHVSVLKGKAAIKLYGKEAEKGVLLIETKN